MTQTVDGALAALRDVVLTAAAAGQPALTAAYAYPAQQATMPETIEAEYLPIAIAHRRTNRRTAVGSLAAGRARHVWTAYIDLLLLPGPLQNEEQIRQADAMFQPWLVAMYGVLFTNLSLNGTADGVGWAVTQSTMFDYIDTHLQWFQKTFWGIRFELPVKQSWPQSMIAG